MAYEIPKFTHTLKAAGDLSTKQYYFMKLDAAGDVTVPTAATDIPCGVLQNKPDAAGKAAEIMSLGISKISQDADLAVGDLIGTSADGQAAKKTVGTDTTHYVVGQLLEDGGAAAAIGSALINCMNPHRAA